MSGPTKKTILIVDDHPLVREGMEQMLLSEGFAVKTAANGLEAKQLCARHGAQPDLVISDVRMPEMDGFALLDFLHKSAPDLRVLLLAGAPLVNEVDRARIGGAAGYLPKSTPWRQLVESIRQALAGAPFQCEDMPPEETGPLTGREVEVLRYLNLGKTREEIGIILGIGPETVKSHVKAIMAKLDVPSATGAVGRAYELGILRA